MDIYGRILVNVFDIHTRKSINRALLDAKCYLTQEPIAKEYVRPLKTRNMFKPEEGSIPPYYHIIYNDK